MSGRARPWVILGLVPYLASFDDEGSGTVSAVCVTELHSSGYPVRLSCLDAHGLFLGGWQSERPEGMRGARDFIEGGRMVKMGRSFFVSGSFVMLTGELETVGADGFYRDGPDLGLGPGLITCPGATP